METPAFHDAFAAALARRKVTLAWLHDRLDAIGHPVSVTALSYWRSGRSQPERGTSLDALAEIERLLGVERGALARLIGPSRRPGPQAPEMSADQLFSSMPGMQGALEGLGFRTLFDEVTEQLRHLVVDLDADGRMTGAEIRALVRARHDGARRIPFVIAFDDECSARFVAVSGCSIGRTHVDTELAVYGVEVLTERALSRGDTHLFALRMEYPGGSADTQHLEFAARRMGEVMLSVRFHPDRIPSVVEWFRQDDVGSESAHVDLAGDTSAHAVARGFGPGVLGVSWTW